MGVARAGPVGRAGAASSGRHGVYPGSFNPPTVAHLAISEVAIAHHRLDSLTWMVSHRALAKEDDATPDPDERRAMLEAVAATVPELVVAFTNDQLLADIAQGFDLIVMGADKWHQIHEVRWYDNDPERRDEALARLPQVAVAPRDDLPDAAPELVLPVPAEHRRVSSSRARAGEAHLIAPQARPWVQRWLSE